MVKSCSYYALQRCYMEVSQQQPLSSNSGRNLSQHPFNHPYSLEKTIFLTFLDNYISLQEEEFFLHYHALQVMIASVYWSGGWRAS